MRKRERVSVLLAHHDLRILRYLSIELHRSTDIQLQLLTARTIKETQDIIKAGLADISYIDFGFDRGHGEDLITMIRKRNPYHPIIAIMETADKDYRLKILDEYYPVICVTIEVLLPKLDVYFKRAMLDLRASPLRIALEGIDEIEVVDLDEICDITSIKNTKYLEVRLYDFKNKVYKTVMHRSTLDEFGEEFNDYFVRCHHGRLVSKRAIQKIFPAREDNEIVLLYPDEFGDPVTVAMSEGRKKEVLKKMKGVY